MHRPRKMRVTKANNDDHSTDASNSLDMSQTQHRASVADPAAIVENWDNGVSSPSTPGQEDRTRPGTPTSTGSEGPQPSAPVSALTPNTSNYYYYALQLRRVGSYVHSCLKTNQLLLDLLIVVLGVFAAYSIIGGGASAPSASPPIADFPELMRIQSQIQKFLESSPGGISVSYKLVESMSAVRCQLDLVRNSTLAKKEKLSEELRTFVRVGEPASKALSIFQLKVVYLAQRFHDLDRLILFRLYDIQAEYELAISEPPSGLLPLALQPIYDLLWMQRELSTEFVYTLENMRMSIKDPLAEGERLISMFKEMNDALENTFKLMEDILKSKQKQEAKKKGPFPVLWTLLDKRHFVIEYEEDTTRLLANVAAWSDEAMRLVSPALRVLRDMDIMLQDSKEKLNSTKHPEANQESKHIPIELHISSIKDGMKPLSSAISSIQKREIKDARELQTWKKQRKRIRNSASRK
ncbi:hypothetical protein FN846DRAFT_918774 [Sphaerosporella brunnea]|uniref:Uncharacterized protein n=1 Tax=Sphaerosporella brunnea TaxID=1250544 RepID=A0A5J5EZK8_9PEZI|nr:hypothetical protein FN846DRAFT_918774 [Sphaerosporella brunnea]